VLETLASQHHVLLASANDEALQTQRPKYTRKSLETTPLLSLTLADCLVYRQVPHSTVERDNFLQGTGWPRASSNIETILEIDVTPMATQT
jgi:hypothetical protein